MRHQHPPHARCHGFTLLEVTIAVAVLGIALTALHYGQAQSIRAQARTQNVTLGTMKAMERLEEILTVDRFELPRPGESQEEAFPEPYERFRWILRVDENAYLPERIQDLTLTVTWADPDAEPRRRRSRGADEGPGSESLEICLYLVNLQ